ncbi:MAG: hypothetical protein NXH79_04870 [Rhodobacteraceae bacterium]|nr:hypothetical protein [Paracoccaceae bacterium]
MPIPSPPSAPGARSDSAAEKLQVISDLFGTRIAARVAPGPTGAAAAQDRPGSRDDQRLEWQKNRLIEHLRHSGAMGGAAQQDRISDPAEEGTGATGRMAPRSGMPGSMITKPTASRVRASGPASPTAPAPLVGVLSRAGAPGMLVHEHPAILARLLSEADQPTRVTVLRHLPGSLARDVMQRLRAPR